MSHLKQLTRRTRAVVIVLALFGAFGIAQMPGHGQSASLVFETGLEGEIWQALPKFGHPSTCFDFDNFVPLVGCQPTSEDLLYPVDVALSETGTLGSNGFPTDPLNYRVYVTDSFNNRLVVFRYDPTAADANPTDGYGWAPVNVPGAQWNSLNLSTPDHVVTDEAGNVYVADYGHNRVVVFDANGQMLAALPSGVFVYGIDVTPGTVWGTGGTVAVNGIDFGDGVNDLIFYDAATGAEVHRYQAPIGDLTPGGLTLATGIAYDNDASHLVVADYGATRIVSFAVDANGLPIDTDANDGTIPNTISVDFPTGRPTVTPALVFGRPTDFSNPSKGDLQSPFSVNIDARDRILVGDTDNQRLAIYQPSYPATGPATSVFLFELNAAGGLNGYPRGLTEDSVGRLIIVDTVNHEVEVYQIPDIAIVDVTVAGPRSFAPDTLRPEATISGSFVAGDPITVDFSVMVPETQFQVADMVPNCAATDSQGALAVGSGPTLIGWTANVTGDPLADFAADGDIDFDRPTPLDLYRFQCTFTARVEGAVDFQLSAVGNGGVTASQDRQSTAVVGCADCETGVPDITGQVSDPLPARDFYSVDVTIDLNAIDQEDLTHPEDPRAGLPPTGIKRTYWQWVYGPLAVADNDDFFIGCDDYPATTIQCDGPGLASGDPTGFTYPLTYDVQVGISASEYSEGYNTLEYWTVDAAGNRTARKSLTVAVDQTPPTALFNFPTPTGSCWNVSGVSHCWYNGDVSVPFNLFDNFTPSSQVTIDGTSGPFSPLVFNQDGENPPVSLLNLADLAGNVNPESASDDGLLNGRIVHIDRLAPVTQFSCTWTDGVTTMDCSTGGTFPGGTATFSLPATDDLSGVRETYYTISGSANQATASLAPGNTVTVSNTGTATVTYWSNDNAGNVETHRTVQLLLNQPPVAADDARTIPEDSAPVNVGVLANDTDPDGDLLSVAIVSGPAHGTAVVTPGREIAYTANPDYNGPDSLTYTISDGHGGSSTATLAITVTPVNDPPVAVNDATITPEDTPVTIAPATLLANDTDIDGDTLSLVGAAGAVNGTVAVVAGNVVFTPAPNFNGQASFTYSIQDPSGRPASASVTVTVTPVNDPPVAVADAGTTPEDTAVTFTAATLVANDTDLDGDALSVQAVGNPVNGTVVLGGSGAVFTPAADFNGTASFDYTVTDGNGGTSTTTVTVDVTAVNDPPVAGDDTAATTEDTAVTIAPATLLANDTDPEDDTLAITSVTDGVGGTVALVTNQVVFTPAADFTGTASFTYTVDDGNGGSDTATVTVEVSPVNDPPAAVGDAVTTPEDVPLTLPPAALLANDTDVDGDTLTVTAVGNAVNGTVALLAGQVVFTPAPDFAGAASFTYTISDGHGGTASATVIVNVTPVNDPPVAGDDAAATDEDTPLTLAPAMLLGNDTDADGDALSITAVGGAANGAVALVAGQVVFTPAPDFAGAGSFTYTVSDGHGGTDTATVVVTVNEVNDPPVAIDDAVATLENTPVTVPVIGNDSDPDGDPLTVTGVTQPASGLVTINPDGSLLYTPVAGFSGTVTFTYTVSDGRGGVATATVTLTVVPLNHPPVAVDDSYTAAYNSPLTVALPGVLGNDTDADGPAGLTAQLVAAPASGTLALNADGSFTFTPAPGFTGPVAFTYQVSDGTATSNTATVTILVSEPTCVPPTSGLALVNQATTFDGGSLVEGSIQVMTKSNVTYNSGAVFHGDLLIVGTPTVVINGTSHTYGGTVDGTGAATPTGHKVTINGNTTLGHVVRRTDPVALPVVTNPPASAGTRNVNLNNGSDDPGDFSTIRDLTLNGNIGALPIPEGTYRNFTANGQNAFVLGVAGATVPAEYNFQSLTMNGQSTLQVVGPVVVTVKNAQTFSGLVGNQSHPEWLTFRVAASGGLQLNGQTALYGYVEVPNGKVIINGGTRLEGGLAADKLTMNGNATLILVPLNPCPPDGPVNTPPVALDDTAATTEGQAVTIAPLGNDSDADFDVLTVTAVNVNAANATVSVNPDGTLTYVPAAGFTGTDTFTYTIGDGRGGVASASVTVTVAAANHAPAAIDDQATTTKGQAVTVLTLVNDNDPDGDTLTVTGVTQPSSGAVTINGDGSLTYAPANGFKGTATFTYTVDDGNGGTDTATVTVTVAKSGGQDGDDHDNGDDDHHGGDDGHHDGDDDHGHYPGDRDGCHDYSKNWEQDWNWGHDGGDDHDSDGGRGDDDHGGHYPGDRDGCRNYSRNGDWSFDSDHSDRDGDRNHWSGYDDDRRGDDTRDNDRDRDSHSGHYNGDRDGCRNYSRNGGFSWNTGGW